MTRQLSIEYHGDNLEAFRGKLWAYTPTVGEYGCGLGIAVSNEAGYNPVSATLYLVVYYEEASAEADRLNGLMGLGEDCAMRIVASSMAAGKVKAA